jgi:hypothetical protein
MAEGSEETRLGRPPKKWKYAHVFNPSMGVVAQWLTDLSENGWEYVALVHSGNNFVALVRKPK